MPAADDDPGVGPVAALTFRATVDVPARFRNSRAVGAVLGSTIQASIRRAQSNRRDIEVRRRDDAGDALRSRPDHAGPLSEMVLAQGLGDADRQAPRHEEGVALARRLAVIMHRIWVEAPSSAGADNRLRQHDNATSNPIGENPSSTTRWHESLTGRWMSEFACSLDLPSPDGKAARKIVPPRSRSDDGRALVPIWKRSTSP